MKKNIRQTLCSLLSIFMVAALFAGCGKTDDKITVVSREDGSGTRGAFIELFGIEEKDADGNKIDRTIATAETTNSTSVMMTSISGNASGIGYVSLGSLNNTVKALTIDGAAPSVDNIKNGTYKVSRPFLIATRADAGELTEDFIRFIMSESGQAVVAEKGYIPQESAAAYTKDGARSGKITVEGSSSVTPVMQLLKEAYVALNPSVEIAIQQTDSSTGIRTLIEGYCDIGMASRALKDSELAAGLAVTEIATDGIAVIVNHQNSIDGLTSEQVKKIYTGEITDWSELKG